MAERYLKTRKALGICGGRKRNWAGLRASAAAFGELCVGP